MKITDTDKWVIEITLSDKFREDEFGQLTSNQKSMAGLNIDYYERGYSDEIAGQLLIDAIATLNIIDPIVSIMVGSLYYKNPRSVVMPKKIESEMTAPLVGKILDHYRDLLEVEEVNHKVIWDSYVLGYGVYKIGYATKFGVDIEDDEKKKKLTMVDKALQAVGLKKKEENEVIRPERDLRIVAESPFIEYVNPFDFGIDRHATNLNDARYVYQRFRKTVKDIKANPKYKNKEGLKGTPPDIKTLNYSQVSENEIEDFATVNLVEVHYRNQNRFYLLVICEDESGRSRELYHEESIYDLGEWQFGILTFKKHGHSLYPKSDISKLRALQDRITTTIDSILEQVDKFVPKFAYSESDITPEGKTALEEGGVGALVGCSKNPNEVFKELGLTQLKADLQALINQLIQLISIQTGITGAQLTGATNASTATEITVEQGGQNIRTADMASSVQKMVNHQSRKLWKVIRQFTSLEELQLINGIKGIDEKTGLPKYDWLTVNPQTADQLQEGDYDFDIEVGSTQKVDLAVVRKAFENMFNILARTEVIALMQQQGKKVDLAEILRKYIELFPELGIDSGKLIQTVTAGTTGLVDPAAISGKGGTTQGSNNNALAAQQAQPVPSMSQETAGVY